MDARGELQLAAWLAYFGPFNTPMGLSHALGRRIGASYGRPARIHLLRHPRAEPRGRERQRARGAMAQARGGPRR